MRVTSLLPPMLPVTRNLLIINILCFAAEKVLALKGIDLLNHLGLHMLGAESFHWHQFITYMFLHSPVGFSHIFFNMFALVMFGSLLEHVWGAKRFLFYYLFTGVGAGIIQQLVWFLSLHGSLQANPWVLELLLTVGASGAIYGILLAYGMLFPNMPMFLFFLPIPIKAKYIVIGYAIIEFFLGISSFSGDNIAHFAHLGGMLFGFILILWWRKKYGKQQYY